MTDNFAKPHGPCRHMLVSIAFALAGFWSVAALAQEPFRIGLIAQQGEEAQVEGLSGIKAAFASALGRPVEVLVARDYSVLAQAQIDGRIDYAAYSAASYAAAKLRCDCLVPLAAPLDADGTAGFYSVLIIRNEGAGAQGSLAVGPKDSLATRLVPLAASDAAQKAAAEGRLVEAASAAEAQAMFLQGKIDGFFSWIPARTSHGDDTMAADPGQLFRFSALQSDKSTWLIAWQSALLRYGPHVVRKDLPAIQAKQLAKFLTGPQINDDGELAALLARRHGGSFAAVSTADYKPVEEALGMIGKW